MAARAGFALLCLCVAALPPEELEVLQQLLPLAAEPCETDGVECGNGHVTKLYLKGRKIKEIPENVDLLQYLEYLLLDNNQLQSLPESFGGLKSLQKLHLNNNQLKLLPETFGDLKALQRLYVNSNQLTSLPESFRDLKSLEQLLLENNQLQSLPEAFGGLKSLEFLGLENNQLEHLPESFGDLKSLMSLNLINNRLVQLPESFGNLTNLGFLALMNNQLQCLPETFGDLKSLAHLHLNHNQLVQLPESFGHLTGLEWLNLFDNQLQRLPESFGGLERVSSLDLNGNQLQQLPDSFGGLQTLVELTINGNQLQHLPESFGSLRRLKSVLLSHNQLERLPGSFGGLLNLESLEMKNNRLQHLPSSFRDLRRLQHLALQHNQLEDFLSGHELHLESLEVLLLQHNALQCSVERFCDLPQLTTLYAHESRIEGALPACVASLKRLQVLTLHQNKLTGTIPESLAHLNDLKVLTLHGNHLTGSIPSTFSSSKSLALFSAFDNALTGFIPKLNLAQGCADDMSFSMVVSQNDDSYLHITCYNAVAFHPFLTRAEQERLENACPATLGLCANASARGPTLLLHGNRLSCAMPEQVTEAPFALRSLVLIGNALGNETKLLPSWVAETEHQPFLYVSSHTMLNLCLRSMVLALLCAGVWRGVIGSWRHLSIKQAPENPAEISYLFVIKALWVFSPPAAMLLCIYSVGSSYYACGDRLLASTLAYFDGEDYHILLCICWVWRIFASTLLLRWMPRRQRGSECQIGGTASRVRKLAWWVVWFCIVLCLSAPSMAYAVASTLPRRNSLISGPWLLSAIKSQTAFVMLLVDMLVTPKLAATIAKHSGLRRSMLLMAARTCTMWLNATMFTLYLSEHCHRGWTRLWTVCDASSADYQTFNISLGEQQLLEPLKDLCQQNQEWWSTDACMRSVVGTLAPLFLSKMIQRAFLQPVITLVLWKLSVEEDGQLWFIPLAFLGVRGWRICTSRSLGRAQQATFLVTLAEVVFIWGAFIPLLIPASALAAMTNLRVFRAGTRIFGANVAPENETGMMSKKYMTASVVVLLIFQTWFAWTAHMEGRSLLLLAVFAFLGSLIAPMPVPAAEVVRQAGERVLELTAPGGDEVS